MGFPDGVKQRVLVACRRYCVLCGKFCGTHIELHHIKQHADGGEDTFENCIPLCFDCHADVGTYNSHHAKGTKYKENELIERRDIFYKEIEQGKHHAISKVVAEKLEVSQTILRKLFREEKNAMEIVNGYKILLFSYSLLRESIVGCEPNEVDEIVKWLAEKKYVVLDSEKNLHGDIIGSIRITPEGISFYYECEK